MDNYLKSAYHLMTAFQVSQCVLTSVKLGVFEALSKTPMDAIELAYSTNTQQPLLERLLHLLVTVDVLSLKNNKFHLTTISKALCKDQEGALFYRSMTRSLNSIWASWGNLYHQIKTGETAFNATFKTGLYDYLRNDYEACSVFNDEMDQSTLILKNLVNDYDFLPFSKIFDIGGGLGTLLVHILKEQPHIHGVLYELDFIAKKAVHLIESQQLSNRCSVIAGNFFDSIPSGGDLYILKWILHNWDDKDCLKILKNCRKSMEANNNKLIIIEALLDGGKHPIEIRLMDMMMMVLSNGRERTQLEFSEMLKQAHFSLTQVISTDSGMSIIEAQPV